MGRHMSDRAVARRCFHLAQGGAMRAAGQSFFDSPMLVPERNFQVQHFLPRALKSKMSGLDHTGMNGADGDLVDFAAIHAEEFAVSGRVAAGAADGLKPGMVF